jgi:alanine dehydrogenase
MGWKKALASDPGLQKGLNISEGEVVYKEIIEAFDWVV